MDELNLSAATFQQLVEITTKRLKEFVQDFNTDRRRVSSLASSHELPNGGEASLKLADRLREDVAPEKGTDLESVLDLACNIAPTEGWDISMPGFCAYVAGGGILHTAVAELLSATLNRFTGMFSASPGFVQLEVNVISWLAQVVGYDPKTAFGNLTTGGSMANFLGILVARRHHLTEHELTHGAVMVTSQTHSCIAKGLMMAGLPQSSICQVPVDSAMRMDVQQLETIIITQKDAGHKPFLVVASAGTTSTGAIDHLRELSEICKRYDVWLHVDGAYGAAFNMTQRGRAVLDGLEEADSIALDLHKSFFLPGSTGVLLVKDRQHLEEAFTVNTDAPFLPELDISVPNFCEMSPELTRNFRGMRLWLPLKLCGLGKWRIALDERLDWTGEFTGGLRKMADIGIEVCTPPSLTIVTFRYMHVPTSYHAPAVTNDVGNGHDGSGQYEPFRQQQSLKEVNHDLLKFINRRGNVFLSPTTLPDGRFVLRVCILSIRLTQALLMACLEDIRQGVEQLQTEAFMQWQCCRSSNRTPAAE